MTDLSRVSDTEEQIVALIFHMFKIIQCAVFCGGRHCLYSKKESCIADTGGYLSEAENSKPALHGIGAPRSALSKYWSLLSGFGQEAVFEGYGNYAFTCVGKHGAVKGGPAETLFEIRSLTPLDGVGA